MRTSYLSSYRAKELQINLTSLFRIKKIQNLNLENIKFMELKNMHKYYSIWNIFLFKQKKSFTSLLKNLKNYQLFFIIIRASRTFFLKYLSELSHKKILIFLNKKIFKVK